MFPLVLQKYDKTVKDQKYINSPGGLTGLNYELESIMHYGKSYNYIFITHVFFNSHFFYKNVL